MMQAMLQPRHVLAAGTSTSPRALAVERRAVVLGGGGALGSAVLEQLLASHRFAQVAALVDQPVQAAVRGFVALHDSDAELQRFAADTALVVFDRVRHAHRREIAFVRPRPQDLPRAAACLQAAGVRRLIVVVPHRAALLPMALQHGLATLDEAVVAALGLEQLVFMRMAQRGASGEAPAPLPQRLAHWMLSQLHWLTPQREQAVQPLTVARVAAALAVQLAQAAPATRVLPAQLLWHAAQQRDVRDTVQAWLTGAPWPGLPAPQKLKL
jgi:hypothetical protein